MKDRFEGSAEELVGEDHQPRVQHDGVEEVASCTDNEGEDKGPRTFLDSPLGRHKRSGEDDDGDDTQCRNHEREPETFEDLGDFHPEIRALDFLLGCTPGDIVREKMGENGLGNVNGQATEENEKEGNPGKVFEEGTQEVTMAEAVLQEGECNVTGGREHDHTGEPDFETVEIPPIDIDSESEQEIVKQGKGRASSDAVVGEHVGHHANFVVHWGLRPQENA